MNRHVFGNEFFKMEQVLLSPKYLQIKFHRIFICSICWVANGHGRFRDAVLAFKWTVWGNNEIPLRICGNPAASTERYRYTGLPESVGKRHGTLKRATLTQFAHILKTLPLHLYRITIMLLTYLLNHWAEPFLGSCQLFRHRRTFKHFMEPEGSIPCSQEPSSYGGQLRIYWKRSRGQPTRGGPPGWGFDVGLTTPHRKK
jgi:hypothetical protein